MDFMDDNSCFVRAESRNGNAVIIMKIHSRRLTHSTLATLAEGTLEGSQRGANACITFHGKKCM